MNARPGVLLVNTGSPASPHTTDVRRYLGEFLMDPRMLTMPTIARWLLVHGIILRTRPARSAHAYRAIWTERGSPLLQHTEALAAGLAAELGTRVAAVRVAMRYGQPSVQNVLADLHRDGVDELLVVPLYPQYSAAAWASAFDAVTAAAAGLRVVPTLRFLPPFWSAPAFLDAVAAVAQPHLADFRPDRVLFSFHSLPESHVRAADRSGHCLKGACCAQPGAPDRGCYRAQCFATARAVAERLALPADGWEVAFQSRFTKKWVQPFTDHRLVELARAGTKRLLVLSPAFVADCLETIEELGMRGRAAFLAAGGEALHLVPCVNSSPEWVRGLAGLLRRELGAGRAGAEEPVPCSSDEPGLRLRT